MSELNQTSKRFYEKAKSRKAIVSRLSDIQPEEIQWLWPGRIALGKLTLISGDPGLGKSLLTTTIAAVVSKGFQWPVDKKEAPVGDVLLLSAEDDPADTIRPRLDAAQADCSRIRVIQSIQSFDEEGKQVKSLFSLKKDIETLDNLLVEIPECKLVVIDPISAYMDGTDSHKNADVRALLAPLNDLAAKYKVAIILVSHLNKGSGNALYRTTGSLAFSAGPRAAYVVARDQENPTRKLFMPTKNNIAAEMGGLAYSIAVAENGSPIIAWEQEPVSMTADEALTALDSYERNSPVEEAVDFLKQVLSGGAAKASDVKKEAREAGIADRTLQRARERMGINPQRRGFGGEGGWTWELPKDSQPKESQPSKDVHYKEVATFDNNGYLGKGTLISNAEGSHKDSQNPQRKPLGIDGDMAILAENRPDLFKQN